jgi:hypothetical protein
VAQQALDAGLALRAKTILEVYLPQAGQEDLRTFEWRYLWRECRDEHAYIFPDKWNAPL